MSTPSSRLPLPPVPPEDYADLLSVMFTRTWNKSHSSDDVAERLGMSHDMVLEWVQHYRAAGLTLKELPREQDQVKYFIQQLMQRAAQRNRERARLSCADQKRRS